MDKLSDKQKSLMLANAMGWKPTPEPEPGIPMLVMFETGDGERLYSTSVLCQTSLEDFWDRYMPCLYYPQNMSLAWRVLNWAIWGDDLSPSPRIDEYRTIKSEIERWWFHPKPGSLAPCYLPPADAQRMWLNKILELVIEAGLVDTEGAKVE